MKIISKYLILSLALLSVLFANPIKVNALNTGFDTNDSPAEKKESSISNINLSLITEEPAKKGIVCFDVNDNHLIAVGQRAASIKKTVCVYSTDGVFQYGYTFECYGTFGVEWDNENLNIYFVRGDIIISVTPSGEVLDVLEVQDTNNNNSHMNNLLNSTKRKIGDTEYALQMNLGSLNIFATSYSKVIATNENDEKSIVYDATAEHLLETRIRAIYISSLSLIFIVAFIGYIIKHKRGG